MLSFPSSLSEHPLLRRMKGYYKVTARRASMEPAAAAGGGSGKKASGSGGGNSRGDNNAAASSSSLPGRPALADLINGTGVFAHQQHEEHDDFSSWRRLPRPRGSGRCGRRREEERALRSSGAKRANRSRVLCSSASPLSALPLVFSRSNSHLGARRRAFVTN